jgi:hypothetical protein
MKPSGKQSHGRTLTLDDLRREDDRRSEARLPLQREIVIVPCNAAAEWDLKEVTLFDCSRHGIGIITPDEMQRGDEFLAKVKTKRVTTVIYRVCHCEKLSDGRYKIGARLVEFVGTPDEILQALLQAEMRAGEN